MGHARGEAAHYSIPPRLKLFSIFLFEPLLNRYSFRYLRDISVKFKDNQFERYDAIRARCHIGAILDLLVGYQAILDVNTLSPFSKLRWRPGHHSFSTGNHMISSAIWNK